MDKSRYNAMISAQDTARSNAWAYIFNAWHCVQWQPLPSGIKSTLCLPPVIGVCSGTLVTRTGAKGQTEFIAWMNRPRG